MHDIHKAMGPINGSLAIRLLYFIGPWTLSPHLKWPLISRLITHEILIDRVESAYDEDRLASSAQREEISSSFSNLKKERKKVSKKVSHGLGW